MEAVLYFRSKRALWFNIATFLPLAIAIYMIFHDPWYLSLVFLPVFAFIFPIYFRTYYTIHRINGLTVVCGLLYKKHFGIGEIRIIQKSSNPIPSPALSLKRIELKFKNNQSVLVSPARQDVFIKALLMINPEIEVI